MTSTYTLSPHFPRREWEQLTRLNGGNGHGNGHSLFSITGRNLAHTHRSAGERAGIAAQLVLGETELVKPTITQVVSIVHVSSPYVRFALDLKPEIRDRVAKGELSLLKAAKANGLLAAYFAASQEEKVVFGVIAGVNTIWDEVIAPSI